MRGARGGYPTAAAGYHDDDVDHAEAEGSDHDHPAPLELVPPDDVDDQASAANVASNYRAVWDDDDDAHPAAPVKEAL